MQKKTLPAKQSLELYAFQKKAVAWLRDRPRAYLAAKMGLGKSAIALSVVKEENGFPLLIVAPKVTLNHWVSEIERWAPTHKHDIRVVSYEQALKLVKPELGRLPTWTSVVFDEAHYLKNSQTVRTKILISNKNGLLSQITGRVLFLSGTPAPNHVGELWPTLRVMGAITEGFDSFTNRYCQFERIWIKGNPITKISGSFKERMPELKERISNHVLQIPYSEAGIELPEVVWSEMEIEAGKVPTQLFSREMLINPADIKQLVDRLDAGNELFELQAFASSISALRRLHALEKVPACVDLIEDELSGGLYENVVVFMHHKDAMDEMAKRLKLAGIDCVQMNGTHTAKERDDAIKKFQSRKVPVMLASILAAGVGINLHSANQMIFLEQDFVPGNNAQAIARCARIGQEEKRVFVRWLTLSNNGLDRRISGILARKTSELSIVFK